MEIVDAGGNWYRWVMLGMLVEMGDTGDAGGDG